MLNWHWLSAALRIGFAPNKIGQHTQNLIKSKVLQPTEHAVGHRLASPRDRPPVMRSASHTANASRLLQSVRWPIHLSLVEQVR